MDTLGPACLSRDVRCQISTDDHFIIFRMIITLLGLGSESLLEDFDAALALVDVLGAEPREVRLATLLLGGVLLAERGQSNGGPQPKDAIDKDYAAEVDYLAAHLARRAPGARRLLELAAESGRNEPMFNLALFLLQGLGGGALQRLARQLPMKPCCGCRSLCSASVPMRCGAPAVPLHSAPVPQPFANSAP